MMSTKTQQWLINEHTAARLSQLLDIDTSDVLTDVDSPHAHDVLGSTEILITGWGSPVLTSDALAAAPRLRAIFHAAGTVKHHLPIAVWDRGVTVVSTADAGAAPVAEFTLAAILFANKHVFQTSRRFAAERSMTSRDNQPAAAGNLDKTVGIIGASRVGRRVIALLQPFDLAVLVADPYADASDITPLGARLCPLPELLRAADVVSIHAPATPATQHMIGAAELAMLCDGATLINTARGALIDHDALTRELISSRISAVLDVTDPEPLPPSSPLYELPNVLLTPHIAGAFNPREVRRHIDLANGEAWL